MSLVLRRIFRYRLLGTLCFTSLILCLGLGHLSFPPPGLGQVATVPPARASQLVRQGVDRYQTGDFQGAIEPWRAALTTYQNTGDRPNTAVVLENLARVYQHLGQLDQAIDAWQQVMTLYRQLGDAQKVGRMLTELAQTYSKLGQHRRAITLLCHPHQQEADDIACAPGSAVVIARSLGDHSGEVAALGSLGNAYYLRGEYDHAIDWLEQGLVIAQKSDSSTYRAAMLNSLGNAYASRAQVNHRRVRFRVETLAQSRSPVVSSLEQKATTNDAQALNYFEQSFAIALQQDDPSGMMQALLNQIPIYVRTQEPSKAAATKQTALHLLERLPDARDTVFAAIDLANLWPSATAPKGHFVGVGCFNSDNDPLVNALLRRALSIAQRIGDRRGESFALGELGHLYECRQDYAQAMQLTQQARWAAADLKSQDSLYLWQWQMGRIFKRQSKHQEDAVKFNLEAIQSYEQAIATLEKIRSDILTASRDLQFDFRDTIEPIYRELATLRLERESLAASSFATSAPTPENPQNIREILQTIDALKLAELQNYFGNDCVLSSLSATPVEQVDPNTAVINTIILPKRTAVILSLPDGRYRLHWIEVPKPRIIDAVNRYRRSLEQYTVSFKLSSAQTLYHWLIYPFEPDLADADIQTLVFVQDGILQSVPMAALHDGRQYLIQQYAIATTPSLQLTKPKVLDRQELKAMILGLTQASTIGDLYFEALTSVEQEIEGIKSLLPGSQQLRDEEFTSDRLQQALSAQNYPIVHIATHATFGAEPEETYLVTGNNEKLAINDFDRLIRSVTGPGDVIELLTLTACQTAVGDDRAALGLAGVAIQAGARSAIASLWYINDAATAQVAMRFYQELLKPDLNKAEALRTAQLALLETGGEYALPAYWAPFILIGNWL